MKVDIACSLIFPLMFQQFSLQQKLHSDPGPRTLCRCQRLLDGSRLIFAITIPIITPVAFWAQFTDQTVCVHRRLSSLLRAIRTRVVFQAMDRRPRKARERKGSGGGYKQQEQAEIASGSADQMHSELARCLLVS